MSIRSVLLNSKHSFCFLRKIIRGGLVLKEMSWKQRVKRYMEVHGYELICIDPWDCKVFFKAEGAIYSASEEAINETLMKWEKQGE